MLANAGDNAATNNGINTTVVYAGNVVLATLSHYEE